MRGFTANIKYKMTKYYSQREGPKKASTEGSI
jgi:hypothetical protein